MVEFEMGILGPQCPAMSEQHSFTYSMLCDHQRRALTTGTGIRRNSMGISQVLLLCSVSAAGSVQVFCTHWLNNDKSVCCSWFNSSFLWLDKFVYIKIISKSILVTRAWNHLGLHSSSHRGIQRESFGAKTPLTLLFSLVSIKGFWLSNKTHKTTSSDVQRLGGPWCKCQKRVWILCCSVRKHGLSDARLVAFDFDSRWR